MTEEHRPPRHSPANAPERKWTEEEQQLPYYALLRENTEDAFIATDELYVVRAWNKGAEQMFGWRAEEALGRKVYEVIPTNFSDEEMARALRDLTEAGRWRGDMIMYHKDGTPVHVEARTVALQVEEGGEITVYLNITRDITERKVGEAELETRARQQAVVAELGLWALANEDLHSLMDDAVAFVAQTLGVEYCKIVELLPSGEELLMRAGVGWKEGLVGSATEEAGLHSEAGYTLHSEEPVIMEDLSTETRFRPSALLGEHGVVTIGGTPDIRGDRTAGGGGGHRLGAA
jgi:PAS domain S-box-containing protein